MKQVNAITIRGDTYWTKELYFFIISFAILKLKFSDFLNTSPN